MKAWWVSFSVIAVCVLVGEAAAQNPTFWLEPEADYTQRCLGGPEEGETCGDTEDCERDAGGALHDECRRVCGRGPDAGEPCASRLDCTGGTCAQQCFCNRWITTVPQYFTAQLRGKNWSPNGEALIRWQVSVELEPLCPSVIPAGWDRPCSAIEFTPCETSANCPSEYPECGPESICQGASHAPCGTTCDTTSICTSQSDYVFRDQTTLSAVRCDTLSFTFGDLLLLPSEGIVYDVPKYFASLLLRYQGTFTRPCGIQSIALSNPFMIDENVEEIGPVDLEGLTFALWTCPHLNIVGSVPPSCTIDGRQPSDPDGNAPAGWTSIAVRFDATNAAGILPEDFTMREVPGGALGNPTGAQTNVPELGWVTLTFPPTNPGVWTCFQVRSDVASEVCLGGLPGDVDGGGAGEAADVPLLVDCIAGTAACEIHQCDMDRSGVCGASDLVRQIDLLNKAESYADLVSSLPACPNPLP